MQVTGFRISNFRSIGPPTGCELSHDGLTVIVGQNEAGKSTVLDGLVAFQTGEVGNDDLRGKLELPDIFVDLKLSSGEISELCELIPESETLKAWLSAQGGHITLNRWWFRNNGSPLQSALTTYPPADEFLSDIPEAAESGGVTRDDVNERIVDWLDENCPRFLLFENHTGLLPDSIPLSALRDGNRSHEGFVGASNFLSVARLSADDLSEEDTRMRANSISKANSRVNRSLANFWKQKIGSKLTVRLEARREGDDIQFWVKDGDHLLYPHQRSQGLRWYLSFFLQMLAASDREAIYLIDEPGVSLHARAQRDVLALFEKIRANTPVVYTTHSPYLVDTARLGRVVAAQRMDSDDDRCPTKLIRSHELGAANRDTLSPIYTAMGADFSDQNAISRDGNVIVEEISAYYYIHALQKLLRPDSPPYHLLPATGADNVPIFANLLVGWGIPFVILLDDDVKGREVRRLLKERTFAESEERMTAGVCRVRGKSIEELFTKTDFKRHVIQDEDAQFTEIADYAKSFSKGIVALAFHNRAQAGVLKAADLQATTIKNFEQLFDALDKALGTVIATS